MWRVPAFRWVPKDLLAGLVLAAIAIPEQVATARLAGMPPETGLFTFVAGAIGFAIFGTNRFLSAGADSTIAPIFAGGLAAFAATGTQDYAQLASLLAIMVGVILVVAALLRAGWIADLLSTPVTTGFFAGVAVHIIIGQLPSVLGVPDVQGPLLSRVPMLLSNISQANAVAVAIGAFVFVMMQVTERLAPKLPGALLAIVISAVCVATLHLQDHGIDVLGALPSAWPHIALPIGQLDEALQLFPLALIVALVCMMQTAAVLRTYPSHRGGPRHVAHDYGGIGAGNILAGCIGAFAVNASPPRTAVIVESGGQSQLASLTAVAITVLLLIDSSLLGFVPHAALGGLLIAIGVRLFRLREMLRIVRYGGLEFLLVLTSAILVIALPIQTGMLASIVLSLLQSFYGVARPLSTELVRAPGTTVWWPPQADQVSERVPGVLVFAPAAPLNFTNADFIRRQLDRAIEQAATPVCLLVIEASGMIDIDYTGSQSLQQTILRLRSNGIDVALARLSSERAQRQAERTGLLSTVGEQRVFRTVEDAVRAIATAEEPCHEAGEDRQ